MKAKWNFEPVTGILAAIMLTCLFACTAEREKQLFTKLPADQTGVHFINEIFDTDSSYSFINEFGYMGGGVGIGDFNNDGLKDIFFSGNQVSCRIYLNEGGNRFRDISVEAGIQTDVWCTGVSVVDINADGYDDIYVSVLGKNLTERAPNLLFINQGNLTFREQAALYGLADRGHSTQAAFFDYDRDGDLDMYLANYLLTPNNTNTIYPRDKSGFSPANDRLYRNDGDSAGAGHPKFTDVTFSAGIKEDGYGLGLSVSDYNGDGWPDIYVGNDFVSNDVLWLNNRNGTFSNLIDKALQHQSYSTMGTDAADLNNDTKPDLVTLDMLPEFNERKKTSVSFMNYERYQAERAMGYEPQFVRNMFQLNNGNILRGDTLVPFFSEIGQLSGIHATDWSWSVLLADFNNDGWKDIHITNGIGRDFIHGDFLEFSRGIFQNTLSREEKEKAIRERLVAQKPVKLSNYLYLNTGYLRFSDSSETAGIHEPSLSNGAAYADLDNDGDLDLVVNNINSEAFLFINNTIDKEKTISPGYIRLKLEGEKQNRKGIGAKVIVYAGGMTQFQEQYPVRGYFSSVDMDIVFGTGNKKVVDSLVIVWPDQKKQVLKNLPSDTTLMLQYEKAGVFPENRLPVSGLFADVTKQSGILHRHADNPYNDYSIQRLLPQKYSQTGPFITTGDINNDGASDFFIGGAFNFSGKFFVQHPEHAFTSFDLTGAVKMEEDTDCLLFDADKDGDNDLLITAGDIQFDEESVYYKPRLYLNDGKGSFSLSANAIAEDVKTIAGCVKAGDYDADGDLDIFIGGRVSRRYPSSPRSFILENTGGQFRDVTAVVCPQLQQPGMVTSAVWTDFDNDGRTDLVVAGEWMPLRFFKNTGGKLKEITATTGLGENNGMWRSLVSADMDNDGDVDFIAGNLGLNNDYRVSETTPMQLFAKDLDNNGSLDPVMFYFIKTRDGIKRSYPAISRGLFAEHVPAIKKKFLRYEDYARAGFTEVFGGKSKDGLMEFSCTELNTCYFENTGNGRFVKHVLPVQAQFAPVNAIIAADLDGDGIRDLLLAGNEYQAEVIGGRYDASFGCFLRGTATKSFTAVPYPESGFRIGGDVKDMELLSLRNGEQWILAALNNDSLRVIKVQGQKNTGNNSSHR